MVFLGCFFIEDDDWEIVVLFYWVFFEMLCDDMFRIGIWSACEIELLLVVWCWEGDHRWLVIVNFSVVTVFGQLRVLWDDIGIIVELEVWWWMLEPLDGMC